MFAGGVIGDQNHENNATMMHRSNNSNKSFSDNEDFVESDDDPDYNPSADETATSSGGGGKPRKSKKITKNIPNTEFDKRGGGYACGLCGLPKRNHTCKFEVQGNIAVANEMTIPPVINGVINKNFKIKCEGKLLVVNKSWDSVQSPEDEIEIDKEQLRLEQELIAAQTLALAQRAQEAKGKEELLRKMESEFELGAIF